MPQHQVIMVASECRGIAKVGGLGDVVWDLSQQLAREGIDVAIVLPRYGIIDAQDQPLATFDVPFAGRNISATLTHVESPKGPSFYFIKQKLFFEGDDSTVYVNSASRGRGPFEDDARRFAFFSSAVLIALNTHKNFSTAKTLHLHDWHTGALALLKETSQRFQELSKRIGTLFTIHNLDYQGIRPLEGRDHGRASSLQAWFPEEYQAIRHHPRFHEAIDPTCLDCFNPMRAGIRFSNRVNTVSPSYATEITMPDDPDRGFAGGRGLEQDLARLEATGRLSGILNGIDTVENDPQMGQPPFHAEDPDLAKHKRAHKKALINRLRALPTSPLNPDANYWKDEKTTLNTPLAVAVTRLTGQKVQLLLGHLETGQSTLEALAQLPLNIVVLGTGDLEEPFIAQMKNTPSNRLLFINQYDPNLADLLYAGSDLFLMPSLFEPCGISQMLAMRYGSLPIATAVGGLKDTIHHRETGFLFQGNNHSQMAQNFVETVGLASDLCLRKPEEFLAMQRKAMRLEFGWEQASRNYQKLYRSLT